MVGLIYPEKALYAIVIELYSQVSALNPFSAKQRPYYRICNDISSFGTKRVNHSIVLRTSSSRSNVDV